VSGPNASDFRMTFGLVRKDEVSRPLCPPGDREEIPSIRRAEPHPGKLPSQRYVHATEPPYAVWTTNVGGSCLYGVLGGLSRGMPTTCRPPTPPR
jgi:hypothetical protein